MLGANAAGAGIDIWSVLSVIAGAVLANSAILAVLAFLGRGIFNHALVRDIEAYKANLKRDGDKEIERIKSDLKRDGDREIEAIRREATRELESYKVKLKKSELMFERQFEAANEMIKLFNATNPRKSYPDMDWGEAMGDVYESAALIESALREYANKHSAALDADDRAALERAESTANDIVMQGHSGERDEVAEKLLSEIKVLRDSLIAKVQGQSSL